MIMQAILFYRHYRFSKERLDVLDTELLGFITEGGDNDPVGIPFLCLCSRNHLVSGASNSLLSLLSRELTSQTIREKRNRLGRQVPVVLSSVHQILLLV